MLTPMKAIRARCIDCCGGQLYEVRLCPAEDCPLWVYRMGHRPKKDKTAEATTEDTTKNEDSDIFE